MAKRPSQQSLDKWTKQKWRTKSGKPSGETGERYLPEKAIKSLSSADYAATTRAKRRGTARGEQFVAQPDSIAEKTKRFRAAKGGMAMKGGKKKPMGYNKGGMVACGASNPATQKGTPKR